MSPSIDWQALEKNICDTLKEWELKVGYGKEPVELYYPQESLCSLLGVPEKETNLLEQSLELFSKKVQERLGDVQISGSQGRYCIRVPESGSRYVREHVQASPFLVRFLEMIHQPGSNMASVEHLFLEYSKQIVKQPGEDGEMIFFFQDIAIDEYVYCVEEDDFGLQYHRFTRADYQKLYEGPFELD